MGNEKGIFIEIFRFLRDWDNHAATIFNRSQSAYLENMQQPRAWGAKSPSSLPGKKIHEVGFELLRRILPFPYPGFGIRYLLMQPFFEIGKPFEIKAGLEKW